MRLFKYLNAEYSVSLEEFGQMTMRQIDVLIAPGDGGRLQPMTQKQRRELAREIRGEHGLQDS